MNKSMKIIRIVTTCLVVAVAAAILIFTIFSVGFLGKEDRSIFGIKLFIVKTDSMSSVNGDKSQGYFNAGDLILVKDLDSEELLALEAGDIITFTSTNPESFGEIITHMVKRVTYDSNGNPSFYTYGTATGAEDKMPVLAAYVIGEYSTRIPVIGHFFNFFKTPLGYILFVFIPFLLLIGSQCFRSVRLFQKYKAEQKSALEEERQRELGELQAEREKLEEERRRQEEMMQRLLDMQATMQGNAPATAEAPAQDTPAPTEDDTPAT